MLPLLIIRIRKDIVHVRQSKPAQRETFGLQHGLFFGHESGSSSDTGIGADWPASAYKSIACPENVATFFSYRVPLAPCIYFGYHEGVRNLTLLTLGLSLFAFAATSVTANGGMLIQREQQGGYDIAVTVWPPEPKTGLLVFTVLIQAVASTNGGGEAHLAPISSDLTLRGEGPSNTTVGPYQPQTVLPGFSHFDVRIPVGREGQWSFTLDVSGPLGNVTTKVPLEVLPSDESDLQLWLLIGAWGIGILLSGGLLVLFFRKLRRSSTTHEE